jgi:hypothetical protein
MIQDNIRQAIRDCFISPNVLDSNWEPANLVDAMDKCAGNIRMIAESLSNSQSKDEGPTLAEAIVQLADACDSGLHAVARALINSLNKIDKDVKSDVE